MSTRAGLREIRRAGVIDHHTNLDHDDHQARAAWAETVERAYDLLAEHTWRGPVGRDQITVLEPFRGHSSGVFEWRTYWHAPDGSESVYVVVRDHTDTPTQETPM